MPPSPVLEDPWFVRAFERIYLDVYPHRNDEEAEGNAAPIMDLLGVRAGQRVLDVACGAGRYSRALGRRGLRVTGVDLSEDLLEEARERSPYLPGSPAYIRWDIRELPFAAQFDGAVSLFTSFGYTEDRGDDLRMMEGVRRALVPGARFLVDFLNAAEVRRTLETTTDRVVNRLRIHAERWLDEDAQGGPRVKKRVEVRHRDSGLLVSNFEEDVRLYTLDDLQGLLEEAGFALDGGPYGDFQNTPYTASSPRVVLVGRRGR